MNKNNFRKIMLGVVMALILITTNVQTTKAEIKAIPNPKGYVASYDPIDPPGM